MRTRNKVVIATIMFVMSFISVVSAKAAPPPYMFGASDRGQVVHIAINYIALDSLSVHNANHSPMPQGHAAPAPAENSAPSPGSRIGTLTVERLGRNIGVYEGESMDSMDRGGERFSFSGFNQGNTSIIGHNRGRHNGFFDFVRGLQQGDILTLYMGGVTRSYAVYHISTITDTDFSPLMDFGGDRLTLVTCLEYQRNMRRIAVALAVSSYT